MKAAQYINAQWLAGEGAELIRVFDPSLGQPFAELTSASAAQVDQAVAASTSGWTATAATRSFACTSGLGRPTRLAGGSVS